MSTVVSMTSEGVTGLKGLYCVSVFYMNSSNRIPKNLIISVPAVSVEMTESLRLY